MLYHPCADSKQVNLLRTLVTSCLYRHIITPNHLLPKEHVSDLLINNTYNLYLLVLCGNFTRYTASFLNIYLISCGV